MSPDIIIVVFVVVVVVVVVVAIIPFSVAGQEKKQRTPT